MRKAIRSSLGRMKWLKHVTPLILPKIVYWQGFMLHFLSNGNSNGTGVFSPFLQKCQRSSIYGTFRTFYALQMLDIADFWEKYFPLSSYMFSYLSKCFNRSKSRRAWKRRLSSNLRSCAKRNVNRTHGLRFFFWKEPSWKYQDNMVYLKQIFWFCKIENKN